MISKLLYVTGNRGKFDMLHDYAQDLGNGFVLEQASYVFFEEQRIELDIIAQSKADQAWQYYQQPLIVDDAGIYFERYTNFPGAMTRFVYETIGFEGLFRLYDEGDRAIFRAYLSYRDARGNNHQFLGEVAGYLIKPDELPTESKLPYVHLLIPDGENQTLYQLKGNRKFSLYDPRVRAFKKMLSALAE